MNNNIENILCCRRFSENTDGLFTRFYINSNKKILEKIFYDNYLLCSWAAKSSTGYVGDIIYCKGSGESELNEDIVNDIFSDARKYFVDPSYEKYSAFFNVGRNNANIGGKIIQVLSGEKTLMLTEDEFNENLELFSRNIAGQFSELNKISCTKKLSNSANNCDITEAIEKDKFSFMGCYQRLSEQNIYSVVLYKLIEKYYGFGESGTIYNIYRMNGNIYSACSGYSIDENIFYTGILAGYSDDMFSDVTDRIRNIELSSSQLEQVKQRFIDDLYFSLFQYGEQITVMPYILNTGENVSFSDIIDTAEKISITDLENAFEKEKYLLKMVV